MNIDLKSFVLGAVVGGSVIVYRASVGVSKNMLKKEEEKKEEINVKKIYVTGEELKRMRELVDHIQNLTTKSKDINEIEAE